MPGGIDAIKPAGNAWAVTKSDSTVFKNQTRAIYVGGAGDVYAWMWDPEAGKYASIPFIGVAAGTTLPIETMKIMAATTATNILGLA